jgi:hypothetical protein
VLEVLEQRVKQFLRRDDIWPLRIPREPLLLDSVVRQALPDEHRRFDVSTLRARTLLTLEWEDGNRWEAWVGVLPSGFKIYCDSGEEEDRLLASGGRNEGDDSDRAFLELLAESAGEHFGIEMSGGAPVSVRSPMDRAFLVECFVNLFETTGTEDTVRSQVTGAGPFEHDPAGHDFRSDVERWLDAALKRRATSSRES